MVFISIIYTVPSCYFYIYVMMFISIIYRPGQFEASTAVLTNVETTFNNGNSETVEAKNEPHASVIADPNPYSKPPSIILSIMIIWCII